jgi:hypothetical protein
METVVIILGVVVVLLAAVLVFVLTRKPSNESALLLKEDLRNLSEDITKLKEGVQTQISDRLDKSQSAMFGAHAESSPVRAIKSSPKLPETSRS